MGWVPSHSEALELLRKHKTPERVIAHAQAVAGLVKRLMTGLKIDERVVIAGALLHDIGRSKTQGPGHGVESAKILRGHGVDEKVARIAETHVGAGIPEREAVELGFPAKDYLPSTLEEMLVCYADKLMAGDRVMTEAEALDEFKEKLGPSHPGVGRMKALFKRMSGILGGKK